MDSSAAAVALGILSVYLVVCLLIFAVLIVCYVFTGISLYQIGKRRGLRNYGLAWVPLGDTWMINAIGDQYETIRTGKKQRLRWWALGLVGSALVLYVVVFTVMFSTMVRFAPLSGMELNPAQTMSLLSSFFAIFAIMVVAKGVMLAGAVLTCINLYRLYRSAKPNCAVAFLVLSIVFNVAMPFFLFACRRYDAPIEYVRDPVSPQTQPPVQQLTAAPQPAPEAQPTTEAAPVEQPKPVEQAAPAPEAKPAEPTATEEPKPAEAATPAEQAAPAEEATPDDTASSEQ